MNLKSSVLLILMLGAITQLRGTISQDDTRGSSNPPLTLESPALEFVDGMHIGVDGQKYGVIMRLRQDLNRIRWGIKQGDGSYIGHYMYQGKPIQLADLVALESKGIDVSSLLAAAKNEFNQKVQPLIAMGRGGKQHMVLLIQEWANKAKRSNSDLLVWAYTPEGQESQSMQKNITTFKQFEQFLDDLVYFLETMLRSCPKAYKQFKDMVDQKLQQQQHKP